MERDSTPEGDSSTEESREGFGSYEDVVGPDGEYEMYCPKTKKTVVILRCTPTFFQRMLSPKVSSKEHENCQFKRLP